MNTEGRKGQTGHDREQERRVETKIKDNNDGNMKL